MVSFKLQSSICGYDSPPYLHFKLTNQDPNHVTVIGVDTVVCPQMPSSALRHSLSQLLGISAESLSSDGQPRHAIQPTQGHQPFSNNGQHGGVRLSPLDSRWKRSDVTSSSRAPPGTIMSELPNPASSSPLLPQGLAPSW